MEVAPSYKLLVHYLQWFQCLHCLHYLQCSVNTVFNVYTVYTIPAVLQGRGGDTIPPVCYYDI